MLPEDKRRIEGKVSPSKMKWLARIEHLTANRPGQAAIGDPHWIVVNCSRHKELPEQRRVALFFRHPTEISALAEAKRLSEAAPGRRFSVFASVATFKVEPENSEAMAAE